MLLLVHSEIGLSGVALVADITLKGLLTCVNSSVAFIFPYLQKNRKCKCTKTLKQPFKRINFL